MHTEKNRYFDTFIFSFLSNLLRFHWLTIIQSSGAHVYNTSSVRCVVCSPPHIRSPSITIYPHFTLFHLLPPTPAAITTLVSVHEFFLSYSFLLNSSPPTKPPPTLTAVSLLSIYELGSILIVSSVCSLD